MTDDELSEFAEALDAACRENGKVHVSFDSVTDGYGTINWCPLGALFQTCERPHEPEDVPGLPWDIAAGFAAGYDGLSSCPVTPRGDHRAFDLGRLFRRLYP